jgi:hypothetical protein
MNSHKTDNDLSQNNQNLARIWPEFDQNSHHKYLAVKNKGWKCDIWMWIPPQSSGLAHDS